MLEIREDPHPAEAQGLGRRSHYAKSSRHFPLDFVDDQRGHTVCI
jgi:hypothetical protein